MNGRLLLPLLLAFVGAGGLTADGPSDADSAACAIKRAMVGRAERALLLCDASKFDAAQFERIGPLDDLDDLVTDAPPPRRLAAALKAARIAVHVAPR